MSAAAPVRLAIYDLDRTLTSLPTWTPFLLAAAWSLAPWRLAAVPLVGVAALARAAGIIDRDRLKEAMHRLLLGPRVDPARLAPVIERFAERVARRHVRPGARAQLAHDRAEGRRIVVATAAYAFYAAAIAARLGIADLVATAAVRDAAGAILPRIDGANCYGPAKLRMIADWLDTQGIARADADIRFYSDHASDAPTFAWADAPVAVTPHRRLRTLAAARGWPVQRW